MTSRGFEVGIGVDSVRSVAVIERPPCVGHQGIGASGALDHVFAYGVGIDLTRRDLQFEARDKGRPWDWGKAFDSSAPIAPLHRAASVDHPAKGRIWLAVNDVVKQDADLAELIWPVPDIIAILSRSMRIRPGDIIMTGTPAGVGPIVPGDRVTGGIDGLGTIEIGIAQQNVDEGVSAL